MPTRRDLETVFARLAPDGDPAYRHDLEGADDMAAHARSVLTGSGLSIPIGAGALLLGTWQGIYLWEHRTSRNCAGSWSRCSATDSRDDALSIHAAAGTK
jgi:secondary thiamine-phosphate synthase enzyme